MVEKISTAQVRFQVLTQPRWKADVHCVIDTEQTNQGLPALAGGGWRVVKIGVKIVRHGCSVIFQMAEVAVPHAPFQTVVGAIAALRPLPPARC